MLKNLRHHLEHPAVKLALGVGVLLIAVVVLHALAGEISWQGFKDDVKGLPSTAIWAAIGFTALSFAAMSLYDVLAVATVAPGKVPVAVSAFGGAGGYAVSNLLGFSWLTGAAVRARLYGRYQVDMGGVGAIVATIWISFWLGISFVLGVILLIHPMGLNSALGLNNSIESLIGLGLLCGLGALFYWLSKGAQTLKLFGLTLSLPTARLAGAQAATAVVDVLFASLALYVLLPVDLANNFALFFLVYVLAIGLGILSHSPGGLGVFEAAIIAGLGAAGRSDVLAALVVFRGIYYILPFICFAIVSAGLLVVQKRHTSTQLVSLARTLSKAVIEPLVPVIAAAISLISGMLLIATGNLPTEKSRISFLQDLFALPLLEASHLIASVSGVLLIVVARGLYLKRRSAWLVAVALLMLGAVSALFRAYDWEGALVLGLALGLLLVFRSAFYRTSGRFVFNLSGRWMALSFIAIAAATWIGFFAFANVPYSNELWWEFAWRGDASRFLRASLFIAVLFAGLSLNSLLNSSGVRLAPERPSDTVRGLIAAAPDAEAFINLMHDKRFLLAQDEAAFIAYADSGSSLISKGDPIGAAKSCEALIWQFQAHADQLGKRCVFYGVSPKYLSAYLDMGFSILKIGEVARVKLPEFTLDIPARKDFRYALKRIGREGLVFEVIKAQDLPGHLPRLRDISNAWLELKNGEEKAFSVGAFEPDYLKNFDHGVLRHKDTGRIMAFATLLQGADKHEIAIDLMRHDPEGPQLMMEALFVELMLWAKVEGYHWFNLGAAPFSGFTAMPRRTLWSKFGHLIFEHGAAFYNFGGLRKFKNKFDPEWQPHYLVLPRGVDAPKVLYEVNGLVSGGLKGLL